jgi:hypothetical protein
VQYHDDVVHDPVVKKLSNFAIVQLEEAELSISLNSELLQLNVLNLKTSPP